MMNYYDHTLASELLYDEAYRTRSYQDTKGYWTVGIGHMLGAEPRHSNVVWSHERIITTFLQDINSSIFEVRKQIHTFDRLSDNRQRIMVNMMFNLGPYKFAGFKKMVRAVNSLRYQKVHTEMLDSKWAKVDVPNRANRLANRWLAT